MKSLQSKGLAICLVLLTLCHSTKEQIPGQYGEWLLSNLDIEQLIPTESHLDFLLQIPLKVDIMPTDSDSDHCIPNRDYCFPSENAFGEIGFSEGQQRCQPNQCYYPECSFTTEIPPLNTFAVDFEYYVDVLRESVPFDSSLEKCGLLLQGKDIRFVNETGECGASPQQPYINLVIEEPESGEPLVNYTLNFTMDVPENILPRNNSQLNFVTIAGEKSGVDAPPESFQLLLNINASGNITVSTSEIFRVKTWKADKVKNSRANIAIQFIQNIIIIYLDGEVAFTISQPGGIASLVPRYSVRFGSDLYRGLLSNVKLYKVAATTNEIYSKYSGLPLAKVLYRPECGCPREYTDFFAFHSPSENKCISFVPSLLPIPRYVSPSRNPNPNDRSTDKWSIFTEDGWMSDITDKATIVITWPQQMFLYSISGVFLTQYIKRPSTMKIEILESPGSSQGAVVYVSDDCMEDYDLTPHKIPTLSPDLIPSRRRRNADAKISPKCFLWDDVYPPQNSSDLQWPWQVPILTPDDTGNFLNDAFSGQQIRITLNGHYNITADQRENWYKIGLLQLYARPNCGGYLGRLQDAPTDMPSYYELVQPGYKAFECQCPEGIGGDRCEECTDIEGLFRYIKRPGVCADCDCSDLTTGKQCNKDTGQCPCAEGGDEDLAGRQCHWYIKDVTPSYGPVAGGTRISITGGYFNRTLRSVSIDGEEQDLTLELTGDSLVTLETTPSREQDTEGKTRTVALVAQLDFDGDAGPREIYRNFEYRPNPRIEDIFPRAAILSGGTYITVTGKFLDSVASPELIVYLRQRDVLIGEIISDCVVESGTKMICEIGDLNEAEPYLLHNKIAIDTKKDKKVKEGIESTSSTTTFITTTENEGSGSESRNVTVSPPEIKNEGSGFESPNVTVSPPDGRPARRRRQASNDDNEDFDPSSSLNGLSGVNFTLGFVFDGHDAFEDLRTNPDPNVRELSILYVFDDPDVFTFKASLGEKVLEYTAGELIKIEGTKLDMATKEGDYIVTIGVGSVCKVTDLTSNQLTCRPPEESPEPSEGNFEKHRNREIPHLQVEVGNIKTTVGYVYYKTNIWVDNDAFRISMIVLIVLVVVILLAVLAYCLAKKFCIKEQTKSYEVTADPSARYTKQGNSKEIEELVPLFSNRKLDPDIQAKVSRCKIPPERLQTGKQVGKGNFGLVFKGQLTTPAGNLKTVAVKTIKEDKEMSFEDLENFLAEGTLMIDFKHENVLSLIGVVFQGNDRPQVVLPYMENGDLCNFVKKEELDIVLADLLHFAYQVANGMGYLAKERFVHRDLAARNCMVDGSYVVKIADFGMSRDIYEQDYYKMENMNKPLPMKWMAVESLKEGRYTSKSDVWSYGITMWELLTRGSTPYPGVNNYYIKDYVSTGKRLDRPGICPPIIYEMMCRCWEHDPDDRPSFSEISTFIEMLLSGKNKPDATSDAEAGYSYARKATKDIPDDYLDSTGYADNLEGNDYYTSPISSASKPPAKPAAPIPSPRMTLANKQTEKVYINTGPSIA